MNEEEEDRSVPQSGRRYVRFSTPVVVHSVLLSGSLTEQSGQIPGGEPGTPEFNRRLQRNNRLRASGGVLAWSCGREYRNVHVSAGEMPEGLGLCDDEHTYRFRRKTRRPAFLGQSLVFHLLRLLILAQIAAQKNIDSLEGD